MLRCFDEDHLEAGLPLLGLHVVDPLLFVFLAHYTSEYKDLQDVEGHKDTLALHHLDKVHVEELAERDNLLHVLYRVEDVEGEGDLVVV